MRRVTPLLVALLCGTLLWLSFTQIDGGTWRPRHVVLKSSRHFAAATHFTDGSHKFGLPATRLMLHPLLFTQ